MFEQSVLLFVCMLFRIFMSLAGSQAQVLFGIRSTVGALRPDQDRRDITIKHRSNKGNCVDLYRFWRPKLPVVPNFLLGGVQ